MKKFTNYCVAVIDKYCLSNTHEVKYDTLEEAMELLNEHLEAQVFDEVIIYRNECIKRRFHRPEVINHEILEDVMI